MKLAPDCIPCCLRHTLEVARIATSDEAIHKQMLDEALREVAAWDWDRPAPLFSQFVQRRLGTLTGVRDPYLSAKRRFNEMALELLPALRDNVERSSDPLEAAARVAIAGNVIDMGVYGSLRVDDVKSALARSYEEPVRGDMAAFREAAASARTILYLADNCGEIVFDRLLIEQLGAARVTLAVRGAPVLNDATLADARQAGLDRVVQVIENGSDAPGTVLSECSDEFRSRFGQADLIIAKGQGNFETLSDTPGNLYFLLKVKCPVVAAHAGLAVGTHAVLSARAWRARRNGHNPSDGLVSRVTTGLETR
jgi:uncharacterized protein with ATP-grasp and redox domains